MEGGGEADVEGAFYAYDPAAFAAYYGQRPFEVLWRALQVATPLLLWASPIISSKIIDGLLQRLMSRPREGSTQAGGKAQAQERAAALRRVLEGAGPTCIKLGQALSNRPDVISAEYMEELRQLQDNVPPFSSDAAYACIEAALGAPTHEIFAELSAEPVAAASLGQVYRGRLRGMPAGEEVAVKVQRPGLARSIPRDMYILRAAARFLKKTLPLRSDLVAIVDEFAGSLFEELNYVNEGANAARFKALYANIPGLVVPTVYAGLTTRQVLTMQWISGTKAPAASRRGRGGGGGGGGGGVQSAAASQEEAEERREWVRLVDIGVQCNLQQLLGDGFFHADPHAGNLLKTDDGKLAYLDFGMMSHVSEPRRARLVAAIVHLINRDYTLLAADFRQLEFLPPDFDDLPAIAGELEGAFSKASAGSGGEKLSNLDFGTLADSLSDIAFRYPFRLPTSYALIIRSLTILEGIAITANPDFKIVDVAYPYVAARLLSSESEQLQSALQEMVLDDRGRLKWSRLLPLFAALSADGAPAPAEPAAGEAGEGGQGEGEVSRTKVVGVVRYLLSERGEVFVDALVEDLIDAADNVQLSANVLLSVASGGLVPPPREKPSIGNLQMLLRVLDTLTDVAAAGVRASVADTAAAWERGLGEGVWQGGVDGGLGGAEAILRSFGIEDREMQRRAVATAERVVGEVARGLAERTAARVAADSLRRLVDMLQSFDTIDDAVDGDWDGDGR